MHNANRMRAYLKSGLSSAAYRVPARSPVKCVNNNNISDNKA